MSAADAVPEMVLLRAVFDHLGAGVYATDTSGRVIAANPLAGQLVGRPAAQTLGQDLHDLLCRAVDGTTLPREKCRIHTATDAAIADSRPDEGSKEFFLRDDGTLMAVIWAVTPLRLEGRTAGAVLVFRDYSTRRAAQEEIAAYLAALEELTARLNLISEISAVLVSTLETREVLRRTSRLLVPELADWAAVDLRTEEAGPVWRVAVHHCGDPDVAQALEGPLPPPPPGSALARALRGAQPVLLDADDLALETDRPLATAAHRDLFDRLGGHSAIVVGLPSRRKVFGALTVARTADSPPYADAEVAVLADIGRRAGPAVDNAQFFVQQRHVAETMQRNLLAPLPHADNLRLAARYRPAGAVTEVGGDWYDAFVLADGVTVLVIGDVVGHDLQAAAHMAELRNMLRGLAWNHEGPPSMIMRHLDDAMTHTSSAPMATAFLARVEGPEGGPLRLHWTNAGHPPPLLTSADGHARYLEDNPDPPAGHECHPGPGPAPARRHRPPAARVHPPALHRRPGGRPHPPPRLRHGPAPPAGLHPGRQRRGRLLRPTAGTHRPRRRRRRRPARPARAPGRRCVRSSR
nr:SpoIIE family protein phosphatase [Streptomyces megasporus]